MMKQHRSMICYLSPGILHQGTLSRRIFYVTCLSVVSMLTFSCSDLTPGDVAGNYPVDIQATIENAVINLTWTETPISSFEEYVVVRSTEPIPNSPEPETSGTAIIIARIDERSNTTLMDAEYPLDDILYYKVWVNIGDRFLSSESKRVDLDFTFIPARADIMAVDNVTQRIIGFDLATGVLFEYDLETTEVVTTNAIGGNASLIRFGRYNGTDEVYVFDNNNSIRVFQRSNLQLKTTLFLGISTLSDFQYADGKFFVAVRSSNPAFAIFDRGNGDVLDEQSGVFQSNQKLVLHQSGNDFIAYNVGIQMTEKYTIGPAGVITSTESVSYNSTGHIVIADLKPDGSEFIATNQGNIIGSALDERGVLDSEGNFFIDVAYGFDNSTITGHYVKFIGNTIHRIVNLYSTDDYSLQASTRIPFQAGNLFSVGDTYYCSAVVFINNQVSTILVEVF